MESKLNKLKKTIPFKWRVQSAIPKNAPKQVILIPYVDARDVAEHLDTIIGSDKWCDEYYEVKGNLFCRIGIKIGDEWVYKSDVGKASNQDKEKGESSDAFKRAAVKWGINRDAYRVGTLKLPCKEYNKQYYPINDKGLFLKGAELHDLCNSIAKIEELENYDIEIDYTLIEIQDAYLELGEKLTDQQKAIVEEIIKTKDSTRYQKALDTLYENR